MFLVTLARFARVGDKKTLLTLTILVALALQGAVLMSGQVSDAQSSANHSYGYGGTVPYRGSVESALAAAGSGQTIPMASHSFKATKDGLNYTDVFVGASPFAATKNTTTINVLIVPVIVQIGTTTFDPTQPDSCISTGISPLLALQQSPLFKSVVFDGGDQNGHAATMNGVNVGTTTYPDAFRRAEYWKEVSGTDYHVAFKVEVASAWTISASTVESLGGGSVISSLCADVGVLATSSFQTYIQNTVIPAIPAITPSTFALFLTKDVVTSSSGNLNCLNGCLTGYHAAFGTPVQTYAVSEYDSTQKYWYQSGIKNVSVLSHEIGEWLDDPLGTNQAPAWGGIGQEYNCSTYWEVGDPLSGTDFPAITMPNKINYTPQELAFWSWFYNAKNSPSIGAGGKFSSNRSFPGPAKTCPPGGTY